MSREQTEQLLKNLRLKAMAEALPGAIAAANKASCSYSDFLLGLLQVQWHARQQSALNWRMKQASIPEQWTLETFPFKQQPGVSRRQIQELAGLDFIGRAENIVLIGQTGVGKSGLAIGLLQKALQNGHRGLFIRAQDLFDEMYSSLADRSTRRLLNRLARFPILLVDELGYLNLRPEQTNSFFKLMEERYNRVSTIITTNIEYDQWHTFLGNKAMVEALLSRLRHRCHTIRIKGPSLREPTG
jgi:DNA replication protein DnaC